MPIPTLPPSPPGWNRTTADLFEELRLGRRSSLGWPESEWALEYERSLLPAGTRFPRDGDVYRSHRPFTATLLIHWHSPSTTDLRHTLPAGTRVRVQSAAHEQPLVVHAVPVDYQAVEKAALGWWIRLRPDYGGYCLALATRDLGTSFTWVPGEA